MQQAVGSQASTAPFRNKYRGLGLLSLCADWVPAQNDLSQINYQSEPSAEVLERTRVIRYCTDERITASDYVSWITNQLAILNS